MTSTLIQREEAPASPSGGVAPWSLWRTGGPAFIFALLGIWLVGSIYAARLFLMEGRLEWITIVAHWLCLVCSDGLSQWMVVALFSLHVLALVGTDKNTTGIARQAALWLLVVWVVTAYFLRYGQSPAVSVQVPVFIYALLVAKVIAKWHGRHSPGRTDEFAISGLGFPALLVAALACALFWQSKSPWEHYQGPRWIGPWDDPNTCGMLMGAGCVLATGLLWAGSPWNPGGGFRRLFPPLKNSWACLQVWWLGLGAILLGVGLALSYSRGAVLGTVIGLLYLARLYRRINWAVIGAGALAVAAGIWFFWHGTADNDPWYVKKLDLSRPSAQNRVTAWRAGWQIMRDHPLGVGWHQVPALYAAHYSPPAGGPGAIATNDYLMLGTQSGVLTLAFFMVYVSLSLTAPCAMATTAGRTQTACRAGALVLVVAFWFDCGLFVLPTAVVFWVLLELGAGRKTTGGGPVLDEGLKTA